MTHQSYPQLATRQIQFMQWEEELPSPDDPNCIYVPNYSANETPITTPHTKTKSKFEMMQSRFPVLRNEKKLTDPFLGSKRAFLVAHKVKAQVSKDVQRRTEQTEERSRAWNWKREMDLLQTNIKLRDGEFLRRQNKIHLKRDEPRISTTTGPRPATRLPRDTQHTEYPKTHLHFFA